MVIRKTIIVVLTFSAFVTCGLSIWSMFTPLMWENTSPSQWFSMSVNRTQATITQFVADDPVLVRDLADSRTWSLREYAYPEFQVMWKKRTYNGSDSYSVKYFNQTRITVPLLLPLLAFSLYPTIAFIRGPMRRWRRRRTGHCRKCGYDLTGNVTGVCSECGAEVQRS